MATDKLRFKVLEPNWFIGVNSSLPLSFNGAILVLPRMLKSVEESAYFESFAQAMETTFKVLGASWPLNFLASSSL